MERCEKITPESYQKTMEQVDEREKRLYLPRLDREGKSLGDQDYMVPSPPERDKPLLTQADLEKYYQENHLTKVGSHRVRLQCRFNLLSEKLIFLSNFCQVRSGQEFRYRRSGAVKTKKNTFFYYCA